MIGSVSAVRNAGLIPAVQKPQKKQVSSLQGKKPSFTGAEEAVSAALGKAKGIGKFLFWGGIGGEGFAAADFVHKFSILDATSWQIAGISAACIALGAAVGWGHKKIHSALF